MRQHQRQRRNRSPSQHAHIKVRSPPGGALAPVARTRQRPILSGHPVTRREHGRRDRRRIHRVRIHGRRERCGRDVLRGRQEHERERGRGDGDDAGVRGRVARDGDDVQVIFEAAVDLLHGAECLRMSLVGVAANEEEEQVYLARPGDIVLRGHRIGEEVLDLDGRGHSPACKADRRLVGVRTAWVCHIVEQPDARDGAVFVDCVLSAHRVNQYNESAKCGS